jgi:hypothetical protein
VKGNIEFFPKRYPSRIVEIVKGDLSMVYKRRGPYLTRKRILKGSF